MNLFSWLPSGIARRIAGTTVTLSLALLALLGTVSYWYIRSLLQDSVRAELEQEADHVSVHFGELLSGINEDLRNLTANALITNSMFDREGRERYLVPFLVTFQFPEQVPFVLTLFDRQGRHLASNFPLPAAAKPLAAEVRQAVFGQDQSYAEVRRENDLWVLVLAYPVVPPAARNAQGVLVSEVVIADLLKRSVHGMTSFGDSSLTVACCGETIWSSGAAVGGITVTRELALDRSRPALDRLRLVLTVQAPADRERAPLRRLTAIYAAVGLAVLLLTLAVARILARRISDPIVSLSSAADRIARGGALDEHIEPQGRDEVAGLARSFNTMLDRLRRLTLDLEQRVDDRMRALSESLEQLREEKLFSETVIDGLPGVFYVLDGQGRLLRWNRNVERITGYNADELGRMTVFDLIPREDAAVIRGRMAEVLDRGSSTAEAHLLLKGGARPPYFFSASRLPLHGRELIIGTGSDLTVQRTAEADLRKSEERFRAIFERSGTAATIISMDRKIIRSNAAFADMLGYRLEDLPGKNVSDISHPDDDALNVASYSGMLEGRYDHFHMEKRYFRKDGTVLWGLLTVTLMHDAEGRPEYFVGMIEDITARKDAEQALRESEEKFRSLIEATSDWIWEIDANGVYTYASPKIRDILGYEPAEVLGRSPFDLMTPGDAARLGPKIAAIIAERCAFHGIENANRHKDGRLVVLETSGVPFFGKDGRWMGYRGIDRDITERKQNERILEELNRTLQQRVDAEVAANREKDRLMMVQARQAALGEVLENIAHQWRQPLNSIGLIIQDLEDAQRSSELTEDYLQQRVRRAMDVVQHMSQTIDSFRRFYRPDRERTTFTLNGSVGRVLAFLESSFRTAGVRLAVSMDEDLPVEGHPNEMAQVLLNILNNARDVLLERKVAEPRVTIRVFREDGRPAVTIADNGGGIPPDILDRIFDPYVTTKEEGRGTGIGLYLSKTIIEKNMGGSLTARNTAEGAEFRIRL